MSHTVTTHSLRLNSSLWVSKQFKLSYSDCYDQLLFDLTDLPRISLYPEMPLTVRSGEHVYIYCNATGEQPVYVNWHTEGHQPLPS